MANAVRVPGMSSVVMVLEGRSTAGSITRKRYNCKITKAVFYYTLRYDARTYDVEAMGHVGLSQLSNMSHGSWGLLVCPLPIELIYVRIKLKM